MKLRNSILSIAAVAAAALFSQASVFAQNAIRVEVPFAFDAAGAHFAAGAYTVKIAPSTGIATLTSSEGRSVMISTVAGNAKYDKPAVRFDRAHSRPLLTNVWLAANPEGYKLQYGKKKTGLEPFEIAAR